MTSVNDKTRLAIEDASQPLPNLWPKTRIASGPLKIKSLQADNHVLTPLLQFIQGIHHSASGYEFFLENSSQALVYRNGDYMGGIDVRWPSANASQAVYVIGSRNVVKAKSRGNIGVNEKYSESVEKAVSLASGLFTRPTGKQLMTEIKTYYSLVMYSDSYMTNTSVSQAELNNYADAFYTNLRVSVFNHPAYRHIQGKTNLLRNVVRLVQAYRQRESAEVSWDTHDPSLDVDKLLAETDTTLANIPNWDMDTFTKRLEHYEAGIRLVQQMETNGQFVLINLIGDIYVFDVAEMHGGLPQFVQFYRKGVESPLFPEPLRKAIHTLYSIGAWTLVKDVGVMLTNPKVNPYDATTNFKLGSLFYIDSRVMAG